MGITERKPIAPRLLVRPAPLKGESLRGFLLRVGELNGLGKIESVFRSLTGEQIGQYKISAQALDNIARSLSLSRDQVEGISYQPADDGDKSKCLFFGHTISKSHLRGSLPAVCPDCLAEQQAISGLWDLSAVCVCPRHGKWLINQCPACGQSLKWNRSHVAICNCGYDLSKTEAQSAPYDVLALTALIHELALNGLPTFDERSLGYPEDVRQTPLNEILGLFRYTENILLPGLSVAALNSGANVKDAFSKNSQVASLLAKLLKRWPNELLIFLTKFSSSGHAVSDIVMRSSEFNLRYRKLLHAAWYPKSFCQKVPNFLTRLLVQFKEEHLINDYREAGYLNPSVVWGSSSRERVLKLGDCLRALGFQCDKDDLEQITPFSTYLKKRKELLSGILLRHEVTYRLGCSDEFLMALVDNKLLRRWNTSEFHERDLAELLSRFEKIAQYGKSSGLGPDDLLPLTGFPRTGRCAYGALVCFISKPDSLNLYKQKSDPIESLADLYVSKSYIEWVGHLLWPEDFLKVKRWS